MYTKIAFWPPRCVFWSAQNSTFQAVRASAAGSTLKRRNTLHPRLVTFYIPRRLFGAYFRTVEAHLCPNADLPTPTVYGPLRRVLAAPVTLSAPLPAPHPLSVARRAVLGLCTF
jgi:hypothetical protein